MSLLLSYAERLYSLDTLDTRFTVSAIAPLGKTSSDHGVTVDKPAPSAAGVPAKRQGEELPVGSQPSKWATPEYILYYVVIAIAVPSMFGIAINVSQGIHNLRLPATRTHMTTESDTQYPKFSPLLSKGWILGRKVVCHMLLYHI